MVDNKRYLIYNTFSRRRSGRNDDIRGSVNDIDSSGLMAVKLGDISRGPQGGGNDCRKRLF